MPTKSRLEGRDVIQAPLVVHPAGRDNKGGEAVHRTGSILLQNPDDIAGQPFVALGLAIGERKLGRVPMPSGRTVQPLLFVKSVEIQEGIEMGVVDAVFMLVQEHIYSTG